MSSYAALRISPLTCRHARVYDRRQSADITSAARAGYGTLTAPMEVRNAAGGVTVVRATRVASLTYGRPLPTGHPFIAPRLASRSRRRRQPAVPITITPSSGTDRPSREPHAALQPKGRVSSASTSASTTLAISWYDSERRIAWFYFISFIFIFLFRIILALQCITTVFDCNPGQ